MSTNRLMALVIVVGTVAALVAGVIWALWWMMSFVTAPLARGWALAATGALPLVGWAGWRLGHLEARGRLDGIDQAVKSVMGAASKTADLRTYTAREVRTAAKAPPPAVALPEVVITRRGGGGSQIVEL